MKKTFNIAIIGLGQIGIYLYNEINSKKKDIEIKTGKKIKIVAISAKNKNKKRKFKINKKIFYNNPLEIIKRKDIDIIIEAIGKSMPGELYCLSSEPLSKKEYFLNFKFNFSKAFVAA